MQPTHKQHNAFLAHEPLPGVAFEHNAYVTVVGGEHVGDSGSLVSVEELGDDPAYLIELESNKDAYIPQSCLRMVDIKLAVQSAEL
ncbi:hypothetical protein [Rhodanobacter sp. A1T4]|uniref:hypothetical protein n=1 Tax=Rhodanobacter sp. A1T4 TaxID=2723087 RepID=UPI001621FCC7|nr:hypothetical protein [Rhodanobacter sp. A1T4]MBB6249226.1 ribosomal protein S4E [Rhodanobacter sp. A1T4]